MANKSIKDSFQRFWQHCVSSFATKEYVDNAVGSGGGASGGLSIKSITFTDRPSALEWILENRYKVIRGVLSADLLSEPLVFDSVEIAGSGIAAVARFSKFSLGSGNGQVLIGGLLFALTAFDTLVTMSPVEVSFSNDGSFTMSDNEVSTLPDAYWPQVNTSLEIYYMG